MAADIVQQLPQLEQMCQRMYLAQAPGERQQMEQMLLVFGQSTEYITHCKAILDNSQSSYAQLLASSSLLKVVTEQTLSVPMKLEMQQYFLSYLQSRGPHLEPFVVTSLVQLLCRTTKLCWFDDDGFRSIVQDCKQLLNQGLGLTGGNPSPPHFLLGLKILSMLVAEFHQPLPGRTLTLHRKLAVAFRDPYLHRVFELALLANTHLQSRLAHHSDSQGRALREQAVALALSCLSYDFIGTCLDESSEDLGTIQVPSMWRPIVEAPTTLQLFLDVYSTSSPPLSSQALECLVRLASVRRSLFTSEAERSAFLNQLVTGTRDILRNQIGLGEHANYHEFCRLLGRLKTNYQLNELVSMDKYQEWIQLVAEFTVNSLNSWQWASGSIHYLLGLWSRLVSSSAYLKGESPSLLETYAPKIIQAYVSSRLESVRTMMAGGGAGEDPLDSEEQLQDQMDSLPYMCRLQYSRSAEYLTQLADPCIQSLQERMQTGAGAGPSGQDEAAVQLLEGQLSWLVHIIGAVIRGRNTSSAGESQETIDGDLASRVFGLIQLLDNGATSHRYAQRSRQRLDLAVLAFLQGFRKVYVGEHVMHATKVYNRMSTRAGLKDHSAVLNLMIAKIANNLKVYSECDDIIQATLGLFQELAGGFMSGKLMLKLDGIAFIMAHHTAQHFPFLDSPANARARTTYYCTLARMLFTEDTPARFKAFVAPLQQVLSHLVAASSNGTNPRQLRSTVPSQTVVGLFRDLQGLAIATNSRRTFGMLFDWLYPAHFPCMLCCLDAWADTPAVTTAVLKFMAEFVLNRSQRTTFEASSPNGILLFREVSKVLVTYGVRVLALAQGADGAYNKRYKGIWLCLMILARALGGNYVNFGVFELYGDPALVDALGIALKMALAIPLQDIIAYRKVARSYFSLLEALCHNHVGALANSDARTFAFLVSSLDAGLKNLEVTISSQCAAAVDNLAGYYFKQVVAAEDEPGPAAQAMSRHLAQRPDLFATILLTLFEVVLFEDCSNQWSLSRPMLSVILVSEAMYAEIRTRLLNAQPPEKRPLLITCLDGLMRDVARNLEPKNRDKFTQNLTNVRHDFRSKQG